MPQYTCWCLIANGHYRFFINHEFDINLLHHLLGQTIHSRIKSVDKQFGYVELRRKHNARKTRQTRDSPENFPHTLTTFSVTQCLLALLITFVLPLLDFLLLVLIPPTAEYVLKSILECAAVHVNQALFLLGLGMTKHGNKAQIPRNVSRRPEVTKMKEAYLFISIKWIMVSSCRTTWLSASWIWSPLGLRSGWSHEYSSETSTITSI